MAGEEKAISREGPRSLSVLLAGMRDEGDESVNDEASEKLQGLVAKLREASAAKDAKVSGVFTLSLNISVLKGHADVVVDITTKEPRAKGRELSLWVTKGGNLSTDAPVQKKLPLEGLAGGQSKGANEESEGGEYRINISKAKEV